MSKYSLSQYPKKTQKLDRTGALKGDPFAFYNIHCCKTSKKWKGALRKKNFFEKSLTMPEKNWKRGPFGIFQHPFCRKRSKHWRGDPSEKFCFEKKSRNAKKTKRGDPIVYPGIVCYAEKEAKNEKRVTIIVTFHFMKLRLKNQRKDPLVFSLPLQA